MILESLLRHGSKKLVFWFHQTLQYPICDFKKNYKSARVLPDLLRWAVEGIYLMCMCVAASILLFFLLNFLVIPPSALCLLLVIHYFFSFLFSFLLVLGGNVELLEWFATGDDAVLHFGSYLLHRAAIAGQIESIQLLNC